MSNLTELPNTGKALADKLERIGVSTQEELASLGGIEAIIRIGVASGSGCYNMLYVHSALRCWPRFTTP